MCFEQLRIPRFGSFVCAACGHRKIRAQAKRTAA